MSWQGFKYTGGNLPFPCRFSLVIIDETFKISHRKQPMPLTDARVNFERPAQVIIWLSQMPIWIWRNNVWPQLSWDTGVWIAACPATLHYSDTSEARMTNFDRYRKKQFTYLTTWNHIHFVPLEWRHNDERNGLKSPASGLFAQPLFRHINENIKAPLPLWGNPPSQSASNVEIFRFDHFISKPNAY